MDSRRFDQLGRWLATDHNRRSTLRGFAGSVLAIALGRLTLQEAAAACKDAGEKCRKPKECCSGTCQGKKGKKKCRCRTLRQPCTGTFSENTCCGNLKCAANGAGEADRCCKPLDSACSSDSECCITGATCANGACCLGEGASCLFVGSAACCGKLTCDPKSGSTCQPVP